MSHSIVLSGRRRRVRQQRGPTSGLDFSNFYGPLRTHALSSVSYARSPFPTVTVSVRAQPSSHPKHSSLWGPLQTGQSTGPAQPLNTLTSVLGQEPRKTRRWHQPWQQGQCWPPMNREQGPCSLWQHRCPLGPLLCQTFGCGSRLGTANLGLQLAQESFEPTDVYTAHVTSFIKWHVSDCKTTWFPYR